MSGSGRYFVAALAGLAALLCTFGAGLYLGILNYPEEQRYQSYRYAADKPLEVDPRSPEPASKSLENREPCREPKGRDESDLCAQWKAARAAEDGALWAKWSFWIGLGGLLGLFSTLYYTREAVNAAREATKDAGASLQVASDNAKAATKLAALTERSLSRLEAASLHPVVEFRPLPFELYPGSVGFAREEEFAAIHFSMIFNIINLGRTAAIIHEAKHRMRTPLGFNMQIPDADGYRDFDTFRPNTILGTEKQTNLTSASIQMPIGSWDWHPKYWVRVDGYIVYTNMLGEMKHQPFAVEARGHHWHTVLIDPEGEDL